MCRSAHERRKGKIKTYEVTFVVDGYIQLRAEAEDEEDAEEVASLELGKALESAKGFSKYELDYPDGPFVETLNIDWKEPPKSVEVKEE